MATEILLEKIEDSLHPVDEAGITALRNVPEKSIVKVKLTVPRSVKQHRFFFALLKLTFDNQREPRVFPTQEKLLDALKIAVGHTRAVRDLEGRTWIVPDSISFGRMGQTEFQELLDPMIRVITDKIIPGVGKADFERQVFAMLKEPTYEDLKR